MSQFLEMTGDPRTNPKSWPIKALPELASYSIGLTYKPENISEDGTIVLRSGNIQNSKIDLTDIVRVNCPIKESIYVQKDDILMCSRNGSAALVGKVAQIKDIPETMTYGAFMTVIRSEYSDFLYLYFQCNDFREQVSKGKSSTMNQITQNMLDKISLPLPDEDTRNKLSDILHQADKSEFDVLKSQFIEMFGSPNNPKFPTRNLGTVCKIKSGTSFPVELERENGDIPYSKVADMNLEGNEVYMQTASRYIDAEIAKDSYLPTGTIIFPKRGAAIHTNKKRILVRNTCVDLNVIGVIPTGELETVYLYWFFRCTNLSDISDNAGIPQINNKHLIPLSIGIPPMDIQQQFVAIVHQADKSEYVLDLVNNSYN